MDMLASHFRFCMKRDRSKRSDAFFTPASASVKAPLFFFLGSIFSLMCVLYMWICV